jgi:hypothetical protein
MRHTKESLLNLPSVEPISTLAHDNSNFMVSSINEKKNMNIILIHPYIVVRHLDIHMSEPLGLVSLATYLKQVFGEEINVSILDLYAMGAENPKRKGDMYVKGINEEAQIHAEISKAKPDMIGITCCFTGYFKEALEIAAMAKRLYPSIPIVMGGLMRLCKQNLFFVIMPLWTLLCVMKVRSR